MGALPQALEIIFEVQMKRSNEKIVRRKIASQLIKRVFFPLSFLFGPLLLSKLLTFFISCSFLRDLKCYKSATFNSTHHIGTLIATEQHTRKFLVDWV
jgi:hypothetical protein